MAENDGGLRQAFGEVVGKLNSFESNWRLQDERAERSRKFLYDKMEGVGITVQTLSTKVDKATDDINEMKPAVRDWVNTKNQFIGGRLVIGVVLGGIISGAAYAIAHFSSAVLH